VSELSEQIRQKHALRKKFFNKKTALPLDAALPLVGPDCADHLYRWPREPVIEDKF